ncbi:MAG TPA: lyase family protein [Jatrophihabitans sp.]|nr:lyase family protein [Jatrophihabitans sp.]
MTGRIDADPARLVHDEVLEPQFRYEVTHLLPAYLAIETVFALEYRRMGLLTVNEAAAIGRALHEVEPSTLIADPSANLSDIAFAIERQVAERVSAPIGRWHVDRSRNDLQSCAQLMFGRDLLFDIARQLRAFGDQVRQTASQLTDVPMPGYTHLQPAQVITPGFYLAALSEEVKHALDRLRTTYDELNRCPLGAGAMAGQELPWDRPRMAHLLGFADVREHALVGVASRAWASEITGELALFGVTLSRFVTDLMAWASGEYGFVDLPDELAGISSAMPQKKNFPIFERIRGKTGHLVAGHLDLLVGLRNTPYANSVEVSKEATAPLYGVCTGLATILRLATAVVTNLRFDADRMRSACEDEYLGGFSLANLLTLNSGVPWRTAQVIAGQYIVEAVRRGLPPQQYDPDLLCDLAAQHGYQAIDPAAALAEAFDINRNLRRKQSPGSADPEQVHQLLERQAIEYQQAADDWDCRERTVRDQLSRLNNDILQG